MTCEIKDCKRKKVARYKRQGKYLCSTHYAHMSIHGQIVERTIYTLNEIITEDDISFIKLYNKDQEIIGETKIDTNMLYKVKDQKWGLSKRGAIVSGRVKLHQLILGKIEGKEIDHIDGNPLNNTIENLRHCTHHQNSMNRVSLGVFECKNKKINPWMAHIKFNYKRIFLGYYPNKEQALEARKRAEKKYFGQYARTCA